VHLDDADLAVWHPEVSSVMPVCGYVVLPRPGALEDAARDLRRIEGCEVFPAENDDLLLLVTESDSVQDDQELRQRVNGVPGIQALLLTFGEIDPDTPMGDPVREARS
jgi:nitrate reductase NapAB chaperone NapD